MSSLVMSYEWLNRMSIVLCQLPFADCTLPLVLWLLPYALCPLHIHNSQFTIVYRLKSYQIG